MIGYGLVILALLAITREVRKLKKEIRNMPLSKDEQAAFDTLNQKVDTLVTAVRGLTAEIADEKAALASALANQNAPEIIAAATALNVKLDAGIAAAQAALGAPDAAPPAAPADVPPAS